MKINQTTSNLIYAQNASSSEQRTDALHVIYVYFDQILILREDKVFILNVYSWPLVDEVT